ncbi:MAG: hypothetical protein IJ688_07370 [Treponema sp.]|nr:hypothetical protein [Treponema sp.]
MKNTKLCKSLLILWIVSLFASCAGLGETKDTKIIVSGSFSGNSNENTARTATSSFSDSLTWSLEAYSIGADGEVDSASKVEGSVKSDLSFTVELPAVGKYQFRAIGKAESQQVFLGLVDENIAESGNNALLIPVSPCSEDDGKIRLSIKDQSSSSLKKLVVKEDGSEISTADFNETGLVELNIANLSCGVHRLILSFEDEIGNVLYSCHEAFNVFGGLTTDIWYGNAPYLTKDDSGSYQFIITSDLITKYGAEIVPSTQMVLYSYDSDSQYSYYLANSATESSEQAESILGNQYNQADFCFDSNGNVYLGTCIDMMQFYYYDGTEKSNNGKIALVAAGSDDFNSPQITTGYLSYDFAKKQLWVASNGALEKFSELSPVDENLAATVDEADYTATVTTYNYRTTDLGIEDTPLAACVYNDIAYLVYKNNTAGTDTTTPVSFSLIKCDISSAEVDDEDETAFSIPNVAKVAELCAGMNLSSSATITDMLYQDGAVYMLLRDVATADTWSTIYSRGALIKYDCLLGTVKTLGWTDTASALSGDKYVYTFYVSGNGYNINYRYDRIGNGGVKGEYDVLLKCSDLGENTPQLYTVSAENEESAFCGPQKFVALKPKKLLIADDGVAFYTDSIGAYKFRNKNRVVTVDLESFAIENVAEASVSFGTDADAVPSNACIYPNLSSLSTDTPIYIYKDGSHEACGDDITQFYYHGSSFTVKSSFFNSGAATYAFPCGDGEEVIDDGE